MTIPVTTESPAIARTLQAIADSVALIGYELRQEGKSILLIRQDEIVERFVGPIRPETIATALAHYTPQNQLAQDWQFDTNARQLRRDGIGHALTEKESLLLGQLLTAYPKTCTRETLLKNVWAMQPDIETHTLETHIYRLRQKLNELSPKPCDILTTDNGYQLTIDIV